MGQRRQPGGSGMPLYELRVDLPDNPGGLAALATRSRRAQREHPEPRCAWQGRDHGDRRPGSRHAGHNFARVTDLRSARDQPGDIDNQDQPIRARRRSRARARHRCLAGPAARSGRPCTRPATRRQGGGPSRRPGTWRATATPADRRGARMRQGQHLATLGAFHCHRARAGPGARPARRRTACCRHRAEVPAAVSAAC